MPAKLHLPETDIVTTWVADPKINLRQLAKEYGCGYGSIHAILHRFLGAEMISVLRREKISQSMTGKTISQEHVLKMRHGVTLDGRSRSVNAATTASVNVRKGKSLSVEHREKLSVIRLGKMKGSDHPNWRGGTSQICWRGTGWTVARRQARERDNNTCRLCGKTREQQGRNMDVHHIKSYFDFATPKEANCLDNLISLCRSCHRCVENGTKICP